MKKVAGAVLAALSDTQHRRALRIKPRFLWWGSFLIRDLFLNDCSFSDIAYARLQSLGDFFFFLFPPNLIKSCVFMKAVTGCLYQCLGHAAIPGCTSGFWRRKRKCKAEWRTSAEVRHFQTHQPHIADCSVSLVWHKTRGFIYSGVHIGVLGQGGMTQSLNGRGVKQVVRMDKIRPKTVICLLLLPEGWLLGHCERGVNEK